MENPLRRKLLLLAIATVVCFFVIACGSPTRTTETVKTAPTPTLHQKCPPGNSYMGCSLQGSLPKALLGATPSGKKFVDVSDWQPNVNWRFVKDAGVFGVVVKAGEGTAQDPTFAEHVAGAKRAGLLVQAYWFVRPVSPCRAEGEAIARTVPHGMRVTLDEEVPGIAGYAYCVAGEVQRSTGVRPADYTSPGTYSDPSGRALGLWQATYGPSLAAIWHPVLAWQYTDAASIAGLSLDESVNYGLFPTSKPKPKPKDIGGAQHYERYPDTWWKLDGQHLRERANVERWDHNHCENPARRAVCVQTHHALVLLLGRDQAVYRRETKAQRNANHLPGRIQGLSHRINNGHGVVRHWL